MLRHLDFFFPNLEEAELLTGQDEPEAVADALLNAGVGCVILKMSAQGCLLADAHGTIRIPAYPNSNCIDTTGAGDTFGGAFIAGLLENRTPEDAAAYANAAASIAVEALGATAAKMNGEESEKRYNMIRKLIH